MTTSMTSATRRAPVLAALTCVLALAGAPSMAEPGVTADTITIGQTTALTGPVADLGKDIVRGARVYFDALNASGGIHGRKIVLVSRDDGYNAAKAAEFVKGFVADKSTFAIFNPLGTPANMALLPLTQEAGMPVMAPYTGTLAVRSPDAVGVFNVRASYADEATKLVEHLTTIGLTKIAVAYQNNAFGKEALDATEAVLAKRNLKLAAAVSIENDASDAVAASEKMLASNPEAVLLGLAGKPTIAVIKYVAQHRRGLSMYALSVLASAANLKLLGPDGIGVTIAQVVPFPTSRTSPIAREYRQAMEKAGHTDVSHVSLEGYINARIMAEGLRRAGRDLTRKGFVDAMHSMKRYDIGGFEVSFGKGGTSGSHLVDLTLIGSDGRLIR